MASKNVIILLVASLCQLLLSMEPTAEMLELQRAQEKIMQSVIGVDLEETHLNEFDKEDDMPKAYEKVLEHILQTAQDCNPYQMYRRSDGVCNNLKNPLWGATLHYQERLFNDKRIKEKLGLSKPSNAYMDGKQIPRMTGSYGFYLPSARTVSVECFPDNKENSDYLDKVATQMSMQWGQYIDHDLVHTDVKDGGNCCSDTRHTCIHPDTYSGGPCFPIGIEDDDRYFNSSCMNFKRSFTVDVDGVHEQISAVTAFVDASTVYGSNQLFQDKLRTKQGGELHVDAHNMLPKHGHLKCRRDVMPAAAQCPTAGDARANVFAGLTVLHVIFVREHNRIARKLSALNPHWDDETIFQESRKIVIALHQKITYDEYLPHVIGPLAMDRFKLKPGNYRYDPEINPGIINEFAVAAFRFGHSQINAFIHTKDKNAPISDTFFQPEMAIKSEKSMKTIIKSQCKRKAQQVNEFFTKELTDKLFKDVDAIGHSTDLVARNVQRGRDHGVLDWNQYFSLAMRDFIWQYTDSNNASDTYKPQLPNCVIKKNVYDDINDIDLFVGGLSERPYKGGLVGPTFAYIIGEQFRRIKDGDRFYYESTEPGIGFTPDQIKEIQKSSLAAVICRNSDTETMQPNVFHIADDYNHYINCSDYPDIDFGKWKHKPQ